MLFHHFPPSHLAWNRLLPTFLIMAKITMMSWRYEWLYTVLSEVCSLAILSRVISALRMQPMRAYRRIEAGIRVSVHVVAWQGTGRKLTHLRSRTTRPGRTQGQCRSQKTCSCACECRDGVGMLRLRRSTSIYISFSLRRRTRRCATADCSTLVSVCSSQRRPALGARPYYYFPSPRQDVGPPQSLARSQPRD